MSGTGSPSPAALRPGRMCVPQRAPRAGAFKGGAVSGCNVQPLVFTKPQTGLGTAVLAFRRNGLL